MNVLILNFKVNMFLVFFRRQSSIQVFVFVRGCTAFRKTIARKEVDFNAGVHSVTSIYC